MSAFIPTSSFVVYPFVGIIDDHLDASLNKVEVEESIYNSSQMAIKSSAV